MISLNVKKVEEAISQFSLCTVKKERQCGSALPFFPKKGNIPGR